MSKLNLPTVNDDAKVATIRSADKQNPDTHVIIEYKGKLHSWEASWLKELEANEEIEVVDDEGNKFKFVSSGNNDRVITEDDIL